jgi:hypothetical protein
MTGRMPSAPDVESAPRSRPVDIPPAFRSVIVEQYYLHSNADRPALRIGVLVDGPQLVAPFAAVLDHISRSNFARLELIVKNALEETPIAPGRRVRGVRRTLALLADPARRGRLGYAAYTRWDRARFQAEQALLSSCDCTSIFDGVEQISVRPIVRGFVHRFPDAVVRAVRDHRLDVLLRFGFNIIRGDILTSARCGVWSYHHGDNEWYRGGPSHFWEIYEGNPCSGVVLQLLTEELDNGVILDKAVAATVPGHSVSANRIRPYLMGTPMVIHALHDLHERGWDVVRGRAAPVGEYRGQRRIYRTPTNADMLRFVVRRTASVAARRLTFRGRAYHWRMAWRRTPAAASQGLPRDISGFSWIESPPGHFYADPFVVRRGDRVWVFFEDYSYAESRGRLACAEFLPSGRLGDVATVLDDGRHLSYPFVFEHGGQTFMIPESESRGSVDLYRATDFPHAWTREKTLLPLGGVDSTVHVHDGKVWLFTTVVDPPGADSTLLLFHADDLFGEWRFHPGNPIAADVRVARNAGRFLTIDGQTIRPAQDCSVRYGYAVHFQRITTLNPREYQETRVGSLLPPEQRGIPGVHTYTRDSGIEFIDGTVLRRLSQKSQKPSV